MPVLDDFTLATIGAKGQPPCLAVPGHETADSGAAGRHIPARTGYY
jgi:hypothetical protein